MDATALWRCLAAAGLFFVPGCQDAPAAGPDGGMRTDGGVSRDGGSRTDGGNADMAPRILATQFSRVGADWAVPTASYGLTTGFNRTVGAQGGRNWTVLDMDGDGRLDLVETTDPATGYVRGGDANASWRVYLNTGTSFSRTGIDWSVPRSGATSGFYRTAWTEGNRSWTLLDMDGDRRLDLVETTDPTTGYVRGGDGNASWRVYLNTGANFARTGIDWSVPSGGYGSPRGFSRTAGLDGNRYWTSLDMNGDGKLDLVETSDPATGNVWGGDGNASWRVYLNTGANFSRTGIDWSVPSGGYGPPRGFRMPSGADGNRYWATLDLDGDGKLDLVETSDPATGNVWGGNSSASWRVYLNTGANFSRTGIDWSVPSGGYGPPRGFSRPAWSEGNRNWTLLDLDGDGKLDLVETSDPATGYVWGGDASAVWRVYPNIGANFSRTGIDWQVPSGGYGAPRGFSKPGWSEGNRNWTLLDLDSDGKLDLVETSDPATGSVWGGDASAVWRVYFAVK